MQAMQALGDLNMHGAGQSCFTHVALDPENLPMMLQPAGACYLNSSDASSNMA